MGSERRGEYNHEREITHSGRKHGRNEHTLTVADNSDLRLVGQRV
jgi:hypothetical protein